MEMRAELETGPELETRAELETGPERAELETIVEVEARETRVTRSK